VTPGGDKRRQAGVTLQAGQINHVVICLESREQSPIRHIDDGKMRRHLAS